MGARPARVVGTWIHRARISAGLALLVVLALAVPAGLLPAAVGADGRVPSSSVAAKPGVLEITTGDLPGGEFATAKLKGGGTTTAVRVPARLRLPAGRYTLVVKNQAVGSTRFYVDKEKYRVVVKSGKKRSLEVSLGVGVREDTRVLGGRTISRFDDGKLTLRAGVAVPDKGDFVAAGVTPETPDGLLGRVTAVQGRTVTTVPADLVEAVPVGSFSLSRELAASTGAAERQGASALKAGSVASGIAKSVRCSTGATMAIEGSIDVAAGVDFDADWGWVRLQSAKVVGRLTEDADLRASVTGNAECILPKTALLARPKRFAPITLTVGPVPVVLVPTLQVYVDGRASVEGQVVTSLTQRYGLKAGMRWSRGDGLTPIGEVEKAFSYSPPGLSASAAAQARVLPELSLLLYGLAGPSVNVNGGLSFDAALPTPAGQPAWTLRGTAGAGASLEVPALRISKRLDDVISGSWIVAQGPTSTPFPVPPPTPPGNVDEDQDGYTADVDCNDQAAAINPGAYDRPGDGIDQDCSGADAVLGTGRVQATLRWDNAADLDLHMTEPDGTHIWYGNRGPTSTGGLLDFDDNVGCGTPGAVENIYWPQDTAASGPYQVWVDTFSPCLLDAPPWRLTVTVDGVVVVDRFGQGTIAPIDIVVP